MKNKNYRKRRMLGLFLALIILIGVWIYWGNTTILINRIEIHNPKIPNSFNNYKIAHISDLHNHDWKNQLIDKLKKESPDIIVITGDIIDSRRTNEYLALVFLIEAKEIAPIYYVAGNHEARHNYYPKFKIEMENLGVHVLDNKSVMLNKNGEEIKLLGIDDPSFTKKNEILSTNSDILKHHIKNMDDGFEGFKILLAHRPEFFQSYKESGMDLIFSGHAHGGQVRLPLIGGIVAPGQGFLPKYDSGLYKEDDSQLVVSRGLGNSIIPIRINNNPELIIIRLYSKQWIKMKFLI